MAGVHVGGYGSDTGTSLYALVQAILRETDIPRIRFASVEPWDLPDDFFALFSNPRLDAAHAFAVAKWGGFGATAHGTALQNHRVCAFGRSRRGAVCPGFNVTTDIIVGFPGETDEEWEQTLAYVESVGFGHMHIFTYSIREGTKAAGLPDQVAESVKKSRSQTLHTLGERLKREWLQQQVG